jgi:hypothetical protein
VVQGLFRSRQEVKYAYEVPTAHHRRQIYPFRT